MLRASFAVAALALACGGGNTAPVRDPATLAAGDATPNALDAGVSAPTDAGASAAVDASSATVAKSPCVFADVTVRPLLADCSERPAAKDLAQASDVDVKLVGPTSRVAPGASVALELRYTNATSAPLRLRFDRGLHVAIATIDPKGAQIDPPPGSPQIIPDPACTPTTCPTMTEGIVVLAPGGVVRVPIIWVAEKKKWPPPARLPCCTVSPGPIIGAGPLASGKYTVRASGPLFAEVDVAETVIEIAK